MKAASHALRSSALQVGFAELAATCLEFEKRASAGPREALRPLLDRMEGEFRRDKTAYEAWQARGIEPNDEGGTRHG